jgi:hypothetical protein
VAPVETLILGGDPTGSALDAMSDSVLRAPQHVSDPGVGKLLPPRQPQHLLVLGPQPLQSGHHYPIPFPTNDDYLGCRIRDRTAATKAGQQTTRTSAAAELVGQHLARYPVEPPQRGVTVRDIADPAPRHQERLG